MSSCDWSDARDGNRCCIVRYDSGIGNTEFAINATSKAMNESSAMEVGVKVRFLATMFHFVMNEDTVGFNQLLDKDLSVSTRETF